jgi:hypothetical protein
MADSSPETIGDQFKGVTMIFISANLRNLRETK